MSQQVPNTHQNYAYGSFDWAADFRNEITMYSSTSNTATSNSVWNSFSMKPFKTSSFEYQLDGLNCGGVPTRTTPTLTPTTLRNIEQTFFEIQCEAESHENEAGFVPPLLQSAVPATVASSSMSQGIGGTQNSSCNSGSVAGGSIFMSMVDTKSWQGGSTTVTDMPPVSCSTPNNLSTIPAHVISAVNATASGNTTSGTNKRSIGGRRPNKENGISPEEEERRNLRRERNKLAAARCRKRRLDHTNELLEETDELEGKKQRLQDEIHRLQIEKEELEFLLEAHNPCCQKNRPNSPEDIKPFLLDPADEILTPTTEMLMRITKDSSNMMQIPVSCSTMSSYAPPKPAATVVSVSNTSKNRPTSLPVNCTPFISRGNKRTTISEMTGVSICTPSAGISLNFDSLLEGGTGWTPVSSASSPLIPSCATQQRNSNVTDLTSPDTMPTKLVSL